MVAPVGSLTATGLETTSISPLSTFSLTTWVVALISVSPSSIASRTVCMPTYFLSPPAMIVRSAGWTLMMRPSYRSRRGLVVMLMYPARAMRSTRCFSIAATTSLSKSGRRLRSFFEVWPVDL